MLTDCRQGFQGLLRGMGQAGQAEILTNSICQAARVLPASPAGQGAVHASLSSCIGTAGWVAVLRYAAAGAHLWSRAQHAEAAMADSALEVWRGPQHHWCIPYHYLHDTGCFVA